MDRFVKHILKPQFYLRYGDDFIVIDQNKIILDNFRNQIAQFLKNFLGLEINHKNDIIIPVSKGVYFLGAEIYPTGRRLKKKIWQRARARLNQRNVSSYYGLVKQHSIAKKRREFDWIILEKFYEFF